MTKKKNPGAAHVPPVPPRRTCGTMPVHERLLRTIPGYREARDASENHAFRASMSPLIGRTGCTKIPVVVHVVYKTAAQNISDAQIKSQITVLNADYRKKNADVGSTPAPFQPVVSDPRVVFELAKTDPHGSATTGIVRKQTNKDSFGDDDSVKHASTGGDDAWPADKYLNIWVCQLGGGLLGYAQFPGGPAATDGVVILHSAFGTTGTAAAPYNLGRSATHEIGHWLNLRHIWGDDGNGCNGSDFVADTPNQAGPNYGTPTFPSVTCNNGPNGDMFMNYMDYVDDKAMFMFTAGQVARMQATLDGLRSSMGTAVACDAKHFPKDAIKEPVKDHIKDPPKEHPKELPKDLVKEHPKDFAKEPHKELAKEIVQDGKSLVSDVPPKSIVDPPKSFFEPSGDPFTPVGNPQLPGGFTPSLPGGGFSPGAGVPFVLATGRAPAGHGDCGCHGKAQSPNAALANQYLQLMNYYAQVHARGQLDQAGLAAWQNAAAAYRQLLGY